MQSFIALYRGPTVSEARLVSASSDATLVAYVAACLLDKPAEEDVVLAPIDEGRRHALRRVLGELLEAPVIFPRQDDIEAGT